MSPDTGFVLPDIFFCHFFTSLPPRYATMPALRYLLPADAFACRHAATLSFTVILRLCC